MVARTRAAARQEISNLLVNNTVGDIEADELRGVLEDLVDSIEFTTPDPTLPPQFTAFLIDGLDSTVDIGFILETGLQTFRFNVSHPQNVQGQLMVQRVSLPVRTVASGIDPEDNDVTGTVENFSLGNGGFRRWRISGTATTAAGGATFQRDFTIGARFSSDYVYIGVDADGTLGSEPPGGTDFIYPAVSSGSQTLTIPTFTGNQFLVISTLTTLPQLSAIIIDSVDQIGAFTRLPEEFTVNTLGYDAYISNNPLVGSIVSGEDVEIRR